MSDHVPVITLDGLSACGKGTISLMLSEKLQWHFLDSGAFYRALAWAVLYHNIKPKDHDAILSLIDKVDIQMVARGVGKAAKILCNGQDVTGEIRLETVSQMASEIAVIALVRAELNRKMILLRKMPGLIADGRDMGSVVFPDAQLKFFLTAEPKERAKRRYKQLKEHGISVNLRDIEHEMGVRDQRDRKRKVAPAKPAPDVVLVDTTDMGIEQVFQFVMSHVHDFV